MTRPALSPNAARLMAACDVLFPMKDARFVEARTFAADEIPLVFSLAVGWDSRAVREDAANA